MPQSPPVTAPPAAPLTSRPAPRHSLTKEADRPRPAVGPSFRLPSAAAGARDVSASPPSIRHRGRSYCRRQTLL
nr:unnamed protein product [Digitaria exilis]